tara:strand:+ start:5662 stop:5826 length:165 start_codon:yes stop_codon:yes gene_type:complete
MLLPDRRRPQFRRVLRQITVDEIVDACFCPINALTFSSWDHLWGGQNHLAVFRG